MMLKNQAIANIYLCIKFQRLAQNDKAIIRESFFLTKISLAWPMVTHAYRPFNGLNFGLISTYISNFIKLGRKMTQVIIGESYFLTKISQAWPMVTHAYRPFNWLNFGWISTHISNFIKIGRKMTKLSSEKAIFWLKSVRRDPCISAF